MDSKPAPAPMEALLAAELPDGDGWQYEPKWDGFRCLASRDGGRVILTSKSGKRLDRYFPEVVCLLRQLKADHFLLDGELIIVRDDMLAFDALQLRLHPALSRVNKLATETPAMLVAFDLLRLHGVNIGDEPLKERRRNLEKLVSAESQPSLLLSPTTTSRKIAVGWLERSGGALDGVIAKRTTQEYRPGERAMIKVKQQRTADCVVGGFRYAEKSRAQPVRGTGEHDSREVGSLLLGLFDDDGLLHHVGFTSALKAEDRPALTEKLEALVGAPGFTGNAPGGPSRWATARSAAWEPLRPKLVVEVRYDQVTGRRFRHGTGLLRWRPDKAAKQCTFDQLAPELRPSELAELFAP